MDENFTIAFVGLGVMGGPMAGHLAAAGHNVRAFNRTESRAEEWLAGQQARGLSPTIHATPAEAAFGADMVMTCVGNHDDLEEVVLGPDGVFAGMADSSLLVDHTTVSADLARKLFAEGKERSIGVIDAPISGGQAGAESGKLAIMCGGEAAHVDRGRPAMECYGARIVHVGGAGAGQTTKMCNQMCIAGLLQGLSEAIRLAQASALDTDKVLEAISGGAAQSWQMENRWKTMVDGEFDFGFAIDWMRKDLAYAIAEAKRLRLEVPVSELVDGFYAEVQEMGGARQDTSALIRRLPKGSN